MKFLRNWLSGKQTGASGLPKELLAALKGDIGRLDAAVAGLGTRAVSYVTEGNPESVLLEIASHQQAATEATLVYVYRGHNPVIEAGAAARKAFMLGAESVPHPMLKRYAIARNAIYQNRTYVNVAEVPGWLKMLVLETHSAFRGGWGEPCPVTQRIWSLPRIEACLAQTGEKPEALLFMLYDPRDYSGLSRVFLSSPSLKPYLEGHVDLVAATIDKLEPDGRVALIEELARLRLSIGIYFDLVYRIAIGSAKGPAKAAVTALRAAPLASIIEHTTVAFGLKEGASRRAAAELLALIAGRQAQPLLEAQLAAEPSKPVREAIAALLTQINAAPETGPASVLATPDATPALAGSVILQAIDGSTIIIPPAPAPPADTPLPRACMEPLLRAIAAYNTGVDKNNREREAACKPEHMQYFNKTSLIDDDALDKAFKRLNGAVQHVYLGNLMSMHTSNAYGVPRTLQSAFFEQKQVTLWHAFRLAEITSDYWNTLPRLLASGDAGADVLARWLAAPGGDYRTLIQMGRTVRPELAGDRTVRALMNRYGSDDDEPLELTLQYHILEHLDVFEESFGVRPKAANDTIDEIAAMRLLGRLDKIPDRLLSPLLAIALGGSKVHRALARQLLKPARTIDEAIVARLVDTRKEIRATAAEWLAERAPAGAADAIARTLQKEKAELPRAAMLSALSRLGVDIGTYFDEKSLRKEADAGLAKATKSLDWFPFTALPLLHWMNGKVIDREIIKWWLTLADRLKDPGGNAMFELYLDRMQLSDAAQFGTFILKAWIDRDTTGPSDAEATAHAENVVAQQQQWWASYKGNPPRWAKEPVAEHTFKAAKSDRLGQHLHSAADNKGILGLAVRAPGPDAAALVRGYVKEHGRKVNQAKALLMCLARNRAPSAIQVVLAVANRIKQKTVQALAGELIADVADQRGWTPDELADRTIPSAGLDEDGVMALDCGEDRQFRAVYAGDGKLDLLNALGKSVKALPAARGDADKDLVAAAKKQFADARKELKQTEAAQAERLYEGMCIARSWPVDLWTTCLLDHAIVGRLVQRLVWQGLDTEGKVMATFRVLDDKSLTDHEDNTVGLDGMASVRLGHRVTLGDDAAKAWQQHLADYEVVPLFAQLERPAYRTDGTGKVVLAVKDREGWMIDSLKLKSVATKLGYQTGDVGDGGSYTEYVKRFAGIGIIVSIGFTGSFMGAGAERIEAALTEMTFMKGVARSGKPMKLSDVPGVLISEAIADLRAIAAAGTGFDKEWQKKAHF